MIGRSKNKRQNYPGKLFWIQEKETRVKFNPGLSANRPSNNWALMNFTVFKQRIILLYSIHLSRGLIFAAL